MGRTHFRLIGVLALSILMATAAFAQTSTTGAIEGRATFEGTGLPGVTVEVSSPSLQGTQVAVTDGDGRFRVSLLPPGQYTVAANLTGFAPVRQGGVTVPLGRTATVNITMSQASISEEITVTAEAPAVDVTSTRTGANITNEMMETLPLDRDFYAVAQVAPGTNTDAAGTTFYGSTGAENQYIIDGLNTTGVELGTEAKQLNFDFIEEVEVLTGGLPAEYGRITGGVINAITKSGGNEFSGDVFAFVAPADTAEDLSNLDERPAWTASVGQDDDEMDYGFDLGGYIVPDRLWFFGAYNRQEETNLTVRVQDLPIAGQPTIPAGTAFETDITRDIYAGKLTFRANANHTLTGSIFGDPSESDGAQFGIAGPPSTYLGVRETGAIDYVARYSGVFGSSFLVNALYGKHQEEDSMTGPGADIPLIIDTRPTGPDVLSGGWGFYQNQEFDRDTVKLDLSGFFGSHELKVGGDIEQLSAVNANYNSGGQRIYILQNQGVTFYRHRFYINSETFDRNDPSTWQIEYPLLSEPETENTGFYVQDSWRALPNFTINAGVRLETQEIMGRDGSTAIDIDDNWQPRVGAIWDVMNNGRSKLYANYGRFYEAVPMDINIRAFGGEVSVFSYNFSPDPADWMPDPNAPSRTSTLGGHLTPVDPDLKGQYIDEFLLGYEHEVAPGLALGIKGTHRDLGRIIEDFLLVGTGDYIIANPGSGIGSKITFYDYWHTYDEAYSSAPAPDVERTYTGVELSARKRFSNNWQFFTSYLWSELEGNYDGVFQVSTGQLDPNINSAFDYADFSVNSDGILSNDREHQFKFNGSYVFDDATMLDGLTVGLSAYWASGRPQTAMGYSFLYQNWEYYLTPRGSLGRHPDEYEADLHLGYPINFGNGMRMNLIVDVFNLLDRQSATRLDERYNLPEHGFCGGIPEEMCNGDNGLLHQPGSIDPVGQLQNPRATAPNPDFLQSGVAFTAPRQIRFGVRLSF